jgi:hypothetical protein
MAAGIVALTLEANPNLTWRDVQHIIVRYFQPVQMGDRGRKCLGLCLTQDDHLVVAYQLKRELIFHIR